MVSVRVMQIEAFRNKILIDMKCSGAQRYWLRNSNLIPSFVNLIAINN